ncbi:TonB family protein [Burkholderia cenocepacia]|nr:TonB family protein [Burkholderia cenocepacia]HEB3529825.1 TonB family protein [Burkholderia cenocepacia]
MKAMTKMQYIAVLATTGALLLLPACGPVTRDAARVDGSPDPSAFADALSPAGGVPCRIRRPVYSSLERQQGIRGSVRVTYVVNTAGRIDLAIVDKSSGNQQLDDAARGGCPVDLRALRCRRHRAPGDSAHRFQFRHAVRRYACASARCAARHRVTAGGERSRGPASIAGNGRIDIGRGRGVACAGFFVGAAVVARGGRSGRDAETNRCCTGFAQGRSTSALG